MSVVVENGLRQDGSAFTPGPPVWAGDNFAALRSHFIEQPDLGKTSYLKKLEGQMAGADDRAIQLMAELHYVHLVVPSKISLGLTGLETGFRLSYLAWRAITPSATDRRFATPGRLLRAVGAFADATEGRGISRAPQSPPGGVHATVSGEWCRSTVSACSQPA